VLRLSDSDSELPFPEPIPTPPGCPGALRDFRPAVNAFPQLSVGPNSSQKII